MNILGVKKIPNILKNSIKNIKEIIKPFNRKYIKNE